MDALLVTCGEGLAGLPWAEGFSGVVLATEAALQVGRQVLLERLEADAEAHAVAGPGPPPPGGSLRGPSREKALAALARIRAVHYGESVEVAPGLTATARASGASLGGAFWVLERGGTELGVVMGFSLREGLATPLDRACLERLQAVVFGRACASVPRSLAGVVEAPGVDGVVNAAVKALRSGSCVLAPVHPSGHLFELLEVMSGYLAAYGLSRIPLYYVSPAARMSLSYANTATEWLAGPRQQRAFAPEPPFGHDELLRQGRLRAGGGFSELGAWTEPCVAFVPSGSLACGAGAHLLRRWGTKTGSLLILTEEAWEEDSSPPGVRGTVGAEGTGASDEATGLAAGLSVVRCVLSPGPSPEDVAGLFRQLRASHVAVQETLWQQVQGRDLRAARRKRYLSFSPREQDAGIPIGEENPTRAAPVGPRLQAQLDTALAPIPGLPHVAACRLQARATWDGDAVELEAVAAPPPREEGEDGLRGVPRCTWGQPRLQDLADALATQGFQTAVKRRRVPSEEGGGVLEEEACLDLGGGARVTVGLNRTVVAAPDPAMRRKLAETLLQHLNCL